MTLRNATLSLVILVTSFTAVMAQDECELTLIKATEEFNAGHFFSIPSILAPCIKKNQNREWRQRAYLLLTQTYLLLEDPTDAKNSYLKVLQANPEYATDAQRDPIDLVYFSSKFTAAPIFSLFAYAGSNVSTVKVLLNSNPYISTNPEAASTIKKKYAIQPGFQLGGGVEWHYDENLSATAEFNYMQTSYKKTSTSIFDRDVLDVTDRQSWFRLPISIKFSDHVGKFRPYGYIGFSLDYLAGDNASIIATNNDSTKIGLEESITSKTQESPKIDFKSRRNQFNYSLFLGGGVKYKIGLNYVFVDLRYSSGMKTIVDPKSLVYNYGGGSLTSEDFLNTGDPTFNWWHVDDIFRMNNIILSVGYVHPLYKPRELKRAKTKSILRKIKKQDD